MFYILAIVGFVYCINRINSLAKEVDSLKKLFQSGTPLPAMPRPITAVSESAVHIDYAPAAVATPVYPVEDTSNAFVEWLKKDFLVKLGAFLLLIAFGWFVSYAFANNWIGPMGRISLGILAGMAFMVGGLLRIEKEKHQGSIFTVLGSTIILLTIFAAREMYDFFTPVTALLVMFLSIVLVAKVSVVYRSKSTAVSGLVLASIAPFLTNSPDSDTLMIFSYLTVVVLGSLWVLAKIDAIILQFAAFVVVVLYSIPYLNFGTTDDGTALAFGFLFTVIFFFSNIMSILHRTSDDANTVNLVVASGTGLYLASWIAQGVPSEWQSLLYVAWALVFASGAFVVFVRTNKRVPFYIYSAVSLGLLAAATAAIFEGPMLTLAYTLEVTVLVVLALRVLNNNLVASRLSWLFVGPVMLSLESVDSSAWYSGVLHNDFFILLTLMVCIGFAAQQLILAPKSEAAKEDFTGAVWAFVGSLYAMALVWLVTHAIFLDDQATMFSLLVYTIAGLVMYVQGRVHQSTYVTRGGMLLIAFVVARLLFIDVWQMEISGRIVTFLLVGILLISTAFIKKSNQTNN